MKPLLISSGEPAGIGPDLCLALADYEYPVVILGDSTLLEARAKQLAQSIRFIPYNLDKPIDSSRGVLTVLHVPCEEVVQCGQLNSKNAAYVLDLLTTAAELCVQGEFSAVVTAPVHKAIINASGKHFTGHTEFFADYFQADSVVMLLACSSMKVALVTTHLPLREVADAITPSLLIKTISQLHQSLQNNFAIHNPVIKVAGLNPHAGESGYLGREEIDIIEPALNQLRSQGINLLGPLPADTLFIPNQSSPCDAFVAMYHDQGLAVLKYAGFHEAVNITLGLPIIRTSVDHGTALELAGSGKADTGSMLAAVRTAQLMATNR